MIGTLPSKVSVNILLAMVATFLVKKVTSICVWSVFLLLIVCRDVKKEVLSKNCKSAHRLFCSSLSIQISAKENMHLQWFIWDAHGVCYFSLSYFLKVKLQRRFNMLQIVYGFSHKLLLDMKMNYELVCWILRFGVFQGGTHCNFPAVVMVLLVS